MAKTKRRKPAKGPSLVALQKRVSVLERDLDSVKQNVGSLADAVAGLQSTVKQVDDRSQRGERLMNEMQLEQRRAGRMIDAIARKWDIAVEPPTAPSADPGDAPPPDADEPE